MEDQPHNHSYHPLAEDEGEPQPLPPAPAQEVENRPEDAGIPTPEASVIPEAEEGVIPDESPALNPDDALSHASQEPETWIESITSEGSMPQDLPETESDFSLASVVESILFTSQKPVSAREVLQILRGAAAAAPEEPVLQSLGKTKEAGLREAVDALQAIYAESGRSFEVKESATGWQLVTRPAFAPWLRQLFPENRPARLSAPALETLAIIAYRQPITRADIEAVRGVAVDGVMQTLLDRSLVKIAGRAEVPGRPLLYSTTQHFMEHFGIRDLCELPNSSELRSRPLPTAPVTPVDPVDPADPADPAGETDPTEQAEHAFTQEEGMEDPAEESNE